MDIDSTRKLAEQKRKKRNRQKRKKKSNGKDGQTNMVLIMTDESQGDGGNDELIKVSRAQEFIVKSDTVDISCTVDSTLQSSIHELLKTDIDTTKNLAEPKLYKRKRKGKARDDEGSKNTNPIEILAPLSNETQGDGGKDELIKVQSTAQEFIVKSDKLDTSCTVDSTLQSPIHELFNMDIDSTKNLAEPKTYKRKRKGKARDDKGSKSTNPIEIVASLSNECQGDGGKDELIKVQSTAQDFIVKSDTLDTSCTVDSTLHFTIHELFKMDIDSTKNLVEPKTYKRKRKGKARDGEGSKGANPIEIVAPLCMSSEHQGNLAAPTKNKDRESMKGKVKGNDGSKSTNLIEIVKALSISNEHQGQENKDEQNKVQSATRVSISSMSNEHQGQENIDEINKVQSATGVSIVRTKAERRRLKRMRRKMRKNKDLDDLRNTDQMEMVSALSLPDEYHEPSEPQISAQESGLSAEKESRHGNVGRILVARSRKKLLILDINGLLADIVFPPPKECKADKNILRRAIFKRPFYDVFLKFCFEKFDVGIWSSRAKKIIEPVVQYLLGDMKHKLLFCWDVSYCTESGFKTLENRHKPLVFKELRKLWEKHDPDLPWVMGDYNESNTLLLDDSPYKALLNPTHSAVFPYSYNFKDTSDCSLGPGGDIRVYLEDLASAENIQSYVEQHPFGQKGIDETGSSWDFYSKIVEQLSSASVTHT